MKKFLVAVCATALMASSAFAAGSVAVINGASGKVLVNKGEGFLPVVGALELNAGDRVMVGENSFATLNYAGCAVSVSKPTVVSIVADAPCDDAIVTPTADAGTPAAYAPGGLPLPALLVGAVVVVGGIVVVSEVLGDDDNNNGLSSN